ncbi:MAG TPA: GNAT family N-acetyltransferase [Candidatus Nanopelagicales bacterium]|nr:GNAT family N-acetyltransferase [Candidatus Nanopelagicales bacterium]
MADIKVLVETPRLRVLLPPASFAPRYLAYVERNREHLEPWEPPRPAAYYNEAFWRARILADREDFAADRAVRLAIQRRDQRDGEVIGFCNFNHVIRGAFHAATLGYSLDGAAVGQGLMFEALSAALAYVFGELRLHRVQANYIPTNERSGRLLRRLGFVVEGYARDYLFIGGAWRDHVLTALTSPNPGPPEMPGVSDPLLQPGR